jgi:hypothetical protein
MSTTTIEGGKQHEMGSDAYTFSFDEKVWWNCHHTIACVVLPLLKQFKAAERSGIPQCFFKKEQHDAQEWLHANTAWEATLDSMIAAFQIIADDNVVMSDMDERIVEGGLLEFAAHFMSLWD